MKLSYKILGRLSLVLLLLLGVWAGLFFFVITNEVNDEVDDSLEDYTARIMSRALAGAEMPMASEGSNNSFFITPLTRDQASARPPIQYIDSLIFIPEKDETEAARVLKSIYQDQLGNYYELTVSTPTFERTELLQSIFIWLIILYIVLLISVMSLVMWVFARSTRPLYVLLDWLSNYSVGKTNKPLINPTDITEFRHLNNTVEDFTARAQGAFEQQKQFIANASHEIQTPLAICQNRLEMVMDTTSLTEEQMGELTKTCQTLGRISRLNRSLLLLSKIDNRQFPVATTLNLRTLTEQMLEDFRLAYAHRSLSVHLQPGGPFSVTMDETLATTLLSNMVKNAFVYTPQGGDISIEFSTHCFVISNASDGIALDANKIFDRFYKGPQSGPNATGLGLALVASIARMYNFSLTYSFEGNRHIFTVSCPISD